MVSRSLQRLWADWDKFFFATISARSMAMYRMVFSAFLFYYYLYRGWTFFFFYGPSGIVESGLALPKLLPLQFSLFTLSWSKTGSLTLAFYALSLGLIVSFGCGAFTRLTAVGIWIMTASWLNPLTFGFNACDYMVRIQTFLVMLGALGGAFNQDWALDTRLTRKTQPARSARQVEIWPLRLLQIQLVAIYFYSGVFKLAFPEWRSGNALFYALGNELFGRFDFGWLAKFPLTVHALTYTTLAFELLLFPLFVWLRPVRLPLLLFGFLFHVCIAASMKIGCFLEAMSMFYLAFVIEYDWMKKSC